MLKWQPTQQTLHEVAQELKQKELQNLQRIHQTTQERRLKRLKKKMNRASNENTTRQESTTFQIMYYNALIRELIKEFTKQIKHLRKVVQINIMYSEMSTTFVFTRRLKINGTLEAQHVFPLNTPDLMDEQLGYLFKTFNRIKNFNADL